MTDTTTEAVTLTLADCDAFTLAYLETALWATTDCDPDGNMGEPFDALYSTDDFSPEAIASAIADCESFQETCEADLEAYYAAGFSEADAGHDFWLTRNGHGAGFWDRGVSTGDALSKASKPYGSCDLYVGDDGQIYGC